MNNMDRDDLLDDIGSVVQAELESFTRLEALLKGEHAALIDNNADGLLRAAEGKARQIARIETLEGKRDALAKRAGATPQHPAIDTPIDGQNGRRRTRLHQEWQRLLALAARCQRQNAINGRIIGTSRCANRQALAILHGHAPHTQSEYGPAGVAVDAAPSRPIAKA